MCFSTSFISTPSDIIVGDGSLLPVTSTSSVNFPTAQGFLRLNNVLVSPQLIKNLIPVRQFTTKNNCSFEFDPYGFYVKDLTTQSVHYTTTPYHRQTSDAKTFLSMDDLTLKITHRQSDANSPFRD